MKIIALKKSPSIYTCNAYLLLGDFKTLEDVNALVDVGSDAYILNEIKNIYTGVGKVPVERVIITHGHFDHYAGLGGVVQEFAPEVYAFARIEKYNILPLRDGERIRLADREFEIIHVPGHSNDSVCLYCGQEKLLFSGDAPLRISMPDSCYGQDFITALEKLARRDIETLCSGHDGILRGDVNLMIRTTLQNVLKGSGQKK